MSKATYRRKGILLGLTVSQNELTAIMVGKNESKQAGGQAGMQAGMALKL